MRIFPVALLALVGCASAPKPAPAPIPATPAVAARRAPSAAIARHFDAKGATLSGYVDWTGAKSTTLIKNLVPLLIGLSHTESDAQTSTCVQNAHAGLREILFAYDDDHEERLGVAAYDPKVFDVAACLHSKALALPGADAAYELPHDEVLAVHDGVLIGGTRARVERALAETKGHADFSLLPDEYASVAVAEQNAHGTLTLLMNERHFTTSLDLGLRDQATAEHLATMVQAGLGAGLGGPNLPPEQQAVVQRLQSAIDVQAKPNAVLQVRFDLKGGPVQQATDLGVAASLATFAVSRYLQRAKEAEAHEVLRTLARAVADHYEAAPSPKGKPAKLTSFPAVPKSMPKGEPIVTTQDDWAAWQPLRFSMSAPQRFQYEIVAAKDGKSAEIVARGDLAGDGTVTEFRVPLTLEQNEVRVGHEVGR